MGRDRIHFLFLNVGHFYDHLFVLIFATVAALTLARDWGMTYAELIPYATPGFIAFGAFTIPAGWLADKWSREAMLTVFFIGIGASAIATALADTPVEIAIGLFAVGSFAAIYHPVGLAMVVEGRDRTGVPLAVNGVFGNMGVAAAALITGYLIDAADWRAAFVLPGAVAVLTGIAYAAFVARMRRTMGAAERRGTHGPATATLARRTLFRLFAIIFFSTAIGGLIFQSTTFALPKMLDERLPELAATATLVGWYAFVVFAVAAFAQLVVGFMVDRHSVRAVFACVAGLQAVLLAVAHQTTGFAALLVSVGFMLAVFGQIPINDVLVGRFSHSAWRSRVYAARYIVTFSVSATAVPLIAWIHGAWGFATLFLVLSGAAALIFAAVMMLPRIERLPVAEATR
jgi:MFS family permease